MAITRRSHKAAGASSGASASQAAAHASLRARLARLSLSSWVALAAFLFMAVFSLIGPQGGALGGIGNPAARAQSGAFSSYVFGPSATARWAAEPKPMSQPCPSTKLDPWPLGVEFTRAKSDAGVKCLEYKYTAWQDWRACLFPAKGKDGVPTYAELAKTFPPKHDTAFNKMLQAAKRGSLPWEAAPINGAGVLIVPGKPEGRVLWRGLQNGMDNLPAAWPIYVSGGATALKTVKELFPVEVEVGKITLDDLGDDELNEVKIRDLLTKDTAFYDKLPGETWLFFSVDGALCAPQRDLLEYFIQKDFGWWGPSWRHGWDVMPRFGGGDVFTLRQKRFVYEVINKHTNKDLNRGDEQWFSRQAYDMLGERLSRPPAPLYEGVRFAVKDMFHHKPFATHGPWHMPPTYEMKALVMHCPDFLSTLPEAKCDEWGQAYCAARVERADFVQGVNFACDWDAICSQDFSSRSWTASMHIEVRD